MRSEMKNLHQMSTCKSNIPFLLFELVKIRKPENAKSWCGRKNI
jgi:hypothetical protein